MAEIYSVYNIQVVFNKYKRGVDKQSELVTIIIFSKVIIIPLILGNALLLLLK